MCGGELDATKQQKVEFSCTKRVMTPPACIFWNWVRLGAPTALPVCWWLIRRARCWLIRRHQRCGSIQMFPRTDFKMQKRARWWRREYISSGSWAGLKKVCLSAFIWIFKGETSLIWFLLIKCLTGFNPMHDPSGDPQSSLKKNQCLVIEHL